ncbi:MAG: ABC transporter permease, partial [Pseudomonadota bacterium]
MLIYIARRILLMIPTLFIISVLVFTIIELPPGDYFESYVAELMAQGERVDKAQIAYLKEEYGFDRHPVERYFIW